MSRKTTRQLTAPLEPVIFTIRGQRVILDADLARLYGVPTKRFNEAFKRNRHRFPKDFAFQLTAEEFGNLRSHLATSSTRDAHMTEGAAAIAAQRIARGLSPSTVR